MINSCLVSPAPAIAPQSRMDNTYSALKKWVREVLKFTQVPYPGDRYDADGTWQRGLVFDSSCMII